MLEVKNIKKVFYSGTPEENIVFEDFSLKVNENECTTILGPNGCGKSTLFNIISGSIKEDLGEIFLGDVNLGALPEQERAKYIGKVYQDPSMGVSSGLNIMENMSMALKKGQKFSFQKLVRKENKDFIQFKLSELGLGLEDKLNTKVKFLSGGQRQSLSLLMATLRRPEILLLDEHTAALDPKTSKLIMDKTVELIKREKITTMMITHNLSHAIEYSDRIIMLNKGEITLDVKAKDITEQELVEIYNRKIEDIELIA